MRSLSSYLLIFFMVLFWIFRIVVAFTAMLGIDIGFAPIDMNMEIILCFVTLLSIILVAKNKLLGVIIYLVSYGAYFGVDLYNIIMSIVNEENVVIQYGQAFASFIGILIPICVTFEVLIEKRKEKFSSDKNTDWFYKNKDFDRKLDERVDKNQYRNY